MITRWSWSWCLLMMLLTLWLLLMMWCVRCGDVWGWNLAHVVRSRSWCSWSCSCEGAGLKRWHWVSTCGSLVALLFVCLIDCSAHESCHDIMHTCMCPVGESCLQARACWSPHPSHPHSRHPSWRQHILMTFFLWMCDDFFPLCLISLYVFLSHSLSLVWSAQSMSSSSSTRRLSSFPSSPLRVKVTDFFCRSRWTFSLHCVWFKTMWNDGDFDVM